MDVNKMAILVPACHLCILMILLVRPSDLEEQPFFYISS